MTELNALTYCPLDVHLMLSISSNDVQKVTNLLSIYKIDPDTYFRRAMSEIPAVMLCIDKGNYEIAKVFINQVKVIFKQSDQILAIRFIFFSHYFPLKPFQYFSLCDQGCSVNRTDQNGLSCLHMAVKRQNVELVRLLLEKRAAVNCSTVDNQNSPLHYACTLSSLGE